MKNKIFKLSLVFLFIGNIYASNETKNTEEVKNRPVDDAIKTVVKEDSIKGGDKLKDSYHYEKVSLLSLDKVYQIKRDNLNFPPYKCFIYDSKENQIEIGTVNDSKIDFKIQKSLLSVGDTIIVTNKLEVKSNPFGKFIIEEIEISLVP